MTITTKNSATAADSADDEDEVSLRRSSEVSKKKEKKERQTLVYPGDFLAVEEEFLPDYGSYVDDKTGEVRSNSLGFVERDAEKRSVKVKSRPKVPLLQRRGLKLLGRIEDTSDTMAFVELLPAESANFRFIPSDMSGLLRVSDIRNTYVDSLKSEFKIGDFIRVRIKEVTPTTISVTTNERDLGVIKAFCSLCRHPMKRVGSRLSCENCGNIESRKLSVDYGAIIQT